MIRLHFINVLVFFSYVCISILFIYLWLLKYFMLENKTLRPFFMKHLLRFVFFLLYIYVDIYI